MTVRSIPLLLLMAFSACTFTGKHDKTVDVRYAQFIAGVSLIRSSTIAFDTRMKKRRFRELIEVTGCTSEEAVHYLESIRNDPELAQKLYDTMRLIFTKKSGVSDKIDAKE